MGITRSVIVNALRKLERSAGIIEVAQGMKGTYLGYFRYFWRSEERDY